MSALAAAFLHSAMRTPLHCPCAPPYFAVPAVAGWHSRPSPPGGRSKGPVHLSQTAVHPLFGRRWKAARRE
jgi:hypothetical protein